MSVRYIPLSDEITSALCNHFCQGGKKCIASPEKDFCFCVEAGYLSAELFEKKYVRFPRVIK